MAPLSVVFDSLALNTEITGPYMVNDEIDFGTQALADFIFQGNYRMEELDQALAEERYVRSVVIPLKIKNTTMDNMLANQHAITSRIAAANRFNPKTLAVTPNGASTVSNFRVFGGAFQSNYTQALNTTRTDIATLTLFCDPWVRGASENLGSSGSPLISNTASPATVTLTPTVVGDVPADVTLFVKNRDAAAIRSLVVSAVSENTTWTPLVDSSTWTLGADGTRDTSDATTKNSDKIKKTGTFDQNVIYAVASWAAPTLPTDRRFVVTLRVNDAGTTTRGSLQFRLRHVCGSTEVIGAWRSVPSEASSTAWVGAKMGAWTFPLGSLSTAGTPATTTFLEVMSLDTLSGAAGVMFDFAEYTPEDSTLVIETSDTARTVAAAAGIVQVENDECFTTGGAPAGGVPIGTHIRSRGTSRYMVHASTGFQAALDSAIFWNFTNVDVWATRQSRYIGLA